MADLLIKHLKTKAGEHSALDMLVNQWGFDEKLIPKALQTIGNLFPHYSSHDESHSKQILINIERLLGSENISKLTATDTWLLLEAAYWHDIGMVVPQKDIQEAFEDPEFKQYLTRIKNNQNHDLNEFCLNLDQADVSNFFIGANTPMDAMDKLRLLMSDWFRIKHADRAAVIINSPSQSVGISSPRTELIPNRLFILLSRVCYMHGQPFEKILGTTGLQYREAGLAQEDCHPRFVACLLRIGDLLDIDDNRFCPVMQKIAGDNRPPISKAHEDKHAGIRHLRIDRERIEISAECESIDGYLEAFKWFDWLKQEVQNQMAHWLDIVPSREFGLLPTLGNIHVSLRGNQQLLAEGQRPQFSLDSEQAITLLQGENLYSEKFTCVRELLQNAVDATLLRLWITEKNQELSWQSPLDEASLAAFKNTPISVTLSNTVRSDDITSDKTLWTLRIQDFGTGVSMGDLQYMLKIGGSRKNISRQEKISEMPEWMKPSGTFGIGFQSVFMITDTVKITTKDILSNQIIEVTMYDPKGSKEGLTIIRLPEQDISMSYGTTLEASFLLDKKSPSWSYHLGRKNNSLAQQLALNHDPIDDDFPFEAAQLFDQIKNFSQFSFLPIQCSFRSVHSSLTFNSPPNELALSSSYLEVEGKGLLLHYKPATALGSHQSFQTTYRGQPFDNGLRFSPYLSYLHIQVDLLSGKAGYWLNFNREKILASARKKLMSVTTAALKQKIQSDMENEQFLDMLQASEKMVLSFYLKLMSVHDHSWKELASRLSDWRDLQLDMKNEETYQSLSTKNKWTMSLAIDKGRYPHPHLTPPPEDENGCDLLVNPDKSTSQDIKTVYFDEWLNNAEYSIKALQSSHYKKGNLEIRYRFKKKKGALYTKKSLATVLMQAVKSSHTNIRYLLCFETSRWEILYINQKQRISGIDHLFEIPTRNRKFVILPFLFFFEKNNNSGNKVSISSLQLDKLVNWVIPLLDKESTFEEVREKYVELIDYIDNEIMKPSPFWKDWSEARGLSSSSLTESTG